STRWPGRWPCQSRICSSRLLTRGVSTTISRTVATCQVSRGAGAPAVSIAVIALFFPRVAVDVIAERFPEAWPILVDELQPLHPLRAFPEVEMRDQQPCRASMRRKDRQAVVACRDHGLAAHEIGDWNVGRIASMGVGHEVGPR